MKVMDKAKLAQLIETARRNHAEKLEKEKAARIAGAESGSSNQAQQDGVIQSDPNRGLDPQSKPATTSPTLHIGPNKQTANVLTGVGTFQPTIAGFDYNAKQLEAIELAMRGKAINLIGAAGTGKTTTTRESLDNLSASSHISPQGGNKMATKGQPWNCCHIFHKQSRKQSQEVPA
jgi:Cdc6-like AAA superfamily ATPase